MTRILRPPRTKDGLTITGRPIWSTTSSASAADIAVPAGGCFRPRLLQISANCSLSSARAIEAGLVPAIGTPAW